MIKLIKKWINYLKNPPQYPPRSVHRCKVCGDCYFDDCLLKAHMKRVHGS